MAQKLNPAELVQLQTLMRRANEGRQLKVTNEFGRHCGIHLIIPSGTDPDALLVSLRSPG